MNNVSKPFFFWSYLAAALIAAFFRIVSHTFWMREGMEESLVYGYLAIPFEMYAFVVLAILIYKMWRAIPSTIARTTPARGVGFLFIPVFQFYWYFQALWGWARDWNSYAAESGGKLPRISEGLALSLPVLWIALLCISPFAVLLESVIAISALILLEVVSLLLFPAFIYMVCDRLNAAPALALDEGRRDGFGVASLVFGIYSILFVCIGPVLGIVAVVLAMKQRAVFREPLSTGGLVTGIVGIVLWSVGLVLVVLFIASL